MRILTLYLYTELSKKAKLTADINIKAYVAEYDMCEEEAAEIFTDYDFFENGEIYRGYY